ncbi:MAG: selenium metabolism-associated LysR family transcriptional regulator [Peptococcaceae bacterium]|nr:selenium metabolism-associated LysR family transcriptional regulator [Peptococcaceae bacterium]
MNLHQLKIFAAVARLHSFSKAAVQLNLSQPTVSIHLQKLEESLGLELVEQLGKSIYLTPAGRVLFGYSESIISMLQEAERALAELKGSVKGIVHIGSSTTPGNFLLPTILAGFKHEHQTVELHVEVANSAGIAQKVLANELDFGVVGHGLTPNPSLRLLPLWQDNLIAILAPQNPLSAKTSLALTDFIGQNVILREQGSGTRLVIEESFARAGLAIDPTMEFTGTEGIKHAVAANLGISIVSHAAAKMEESTGTLALRPIKGSKLTRQFYLIQHKDKQPSPIVATCIAYFQHAMNLADNAL